METPALSWYLEFLPGIPEFENWPDFADRNFTSQLDRHYGIEGRPDRRRGRVDVRVGPGGVDVDVERKPARNPDR